MNRFDTQIKNLKEDLLDLLNTVKKEHEDALKAIQTQNYNVSKQIIENDNDIRKVAESLTTTAIWRIASQQPFSTNLRTIIGYMNIIRDLERISNYAKNISKFNVKYQPENEIIKKITNIMTNVFEMIDLIYKAIEKENDKPAYEAAKKDKKIDEEYKKAIKEITTILTTITKNKELVKQYTAGIQQLKYIERLGDHLVNICETIIYISSGQFCDLSLTIEEIED